MYNCYNWFLRKWPRVLKGPKVTLKLRNRYKGACNFFWCSLHLLVADFHALHQAHPGPLLSHFHSIQWKPAMARISSGILGLMNWFFMYCIIKKLHDKITIDYTATGIGATESYIYLLSKNFRLSLVRGSQFQNCHSECTWKERKRSLHPRGSKLYPFHLLFPSHTFNPEALPSELPGIHLKVSQFLNTMLFF